MRKITVLVAAFMMMILAACGSATDVTYEMEEMGIKAQVDISAKGDKIEKQKVVMTLPYDLFMVETKEEAEELVKEELEKELDEFADLDGVNVELTFNDDAVEQTMEIDYKKADLKALEDSGMDFGEEDGDYISLEKTTEQLEEDGFKKVE